MSYSETVATAGDYRARIINDECPQEPDSDGTGHILQVSDIRAGYPRVDVRRADYQRTTEAESLGYALATALDRFGDDWDKAERYLRAWYDVASFDRIDWDRDTLVCIVTRGLANAWGCPPDKVAPAASEGLTEWRAYRDGDVWGVVIDKRVTWVRKDDPDEERDEWEQVEDVWGYYGLEWAEEAAREELAGYTSGGE